MSNSPTLTILVESRPLPRPATALGVLATICVSFTFARGAAAQAGTLDPTFGVGGKVTTDFFRTATTDDARAVIVVQSDGKTVVAGTRSAGNGIDAVLVRLHPSGSLDTSFGNGGKVATDFGHANDRVGAIAIQPDGKLVVAGGTITAAGDDLAVARYLPDGSLDASFGTGGYVTTHLGGAEEAHAVAVQADGRIVVAGYQWIDSVQHYDFLLARYEPDGSLDGTFGSGGAVVIRFGSGVPDVARALAVQADGKLVVAGYSGVGLNNSAVQYFAVARLDVAGSLDPTFDGDGRALTTFGGNGADGRALALQSDGKIVMAGTVHFSATSFDFGVARFNSDGSPDPTLDGDGRASAHVSSSDACNAVAVQADGKILLAGKTQADLALLRFTSMGVLDTSFDGDGRALTSFPLASGEEAFAVAVRSDGRITVAGRASTANTGRDLAVARYLSGGALDAGFDGDGRLLIDIGGPASNDARDVVATQGDGHLLVVGSTLQGGSLGFDFALARYRPDGSLDPSFGVGGRVTTHVGTSSDSASAAVLQPDGKIVVAGSADNATGAWDFATVRYQADGSLDGTFGAGGKALTHFDVDDQAKAIALQGDGKIVVVGDTRLTGSPTNRDFALVRYDANGALDPTFGTGGRVTTDLGAVEFAYGVALQTDGKIVVVGASLAFGTARLALARYLVNGTLDATFGSGGTEVAALVGHTDTWGRAVAVQGDGRIVVAGDTFVQLGGRDFLLARFVASGDVDPTFGSGGVVATDFGLGFGDAARSVALQADGRIVVAGLCGNSSNSNDFALARYDTYGNLDPTFGTGGLVTTDFGGSSDSADGIALLAGKIVLVGMAHGSATGQDFGLARYQGFTDPVELLELLELDVEGHASSATLNHGQARALEAKLEAAILQLDRGNEATAINQLQAFMNQLDAYVAGGILSVSQAQALYDGAAFIVQVILTT